MNLGYTPFFRSTKSFQSKNLTLARTSSTMKKFVFAILGMLFMLTSFGQIFEPYKWSTKVEPLGADRAKLIMTATIQKGWHIYAMKLSSETGIPTSFKFVPGDYKTLGRVKEETAVIEKADAAAGGEVMRFFENQAVFSQIVSFSKPQTISVEVEAMACDDSKCLPPKTETLTFALGGAAEAPAAEAHSTGALANPVKWNFSFEKTGEGEGIFTAKASIEPHWHLYSQFIQAGGPEKTEFKFEKNDNVTLDGKVEESGNLKKIKNDPVFHISLAYFENNGVFAQKVKFKPGAGSLKGSVYYMVCDDKQCMPPTEVSFTIDLQSGVAENTTEKELATAPVVKEGVVPDMSSIDLEHPMANCNELSTDETGEGKSLWMIFFLGFIGGLIALLTPCVFPMIPLTVSFFTKGGSDRKAGLKNAGIYGFFIFLIYILLSLPFHFLDSVQPDILNNISTNPWLNLAFFVIFIVFAISFLGYFEITLPSGIANKVDAKSDAGGLIGSFFMALTLAIVSFSCTGPILGSLLVGSLSKDGGAIQLTMGMGGFGMALALPFTLFAAFPGLMKSLPQSGGWLSKVKVVLGFVELALALKFLSNADLVSHWGVLKYELFLALWILLALGLMLYSFGIIRFPHDNPNEKPSMIWKILGSLSLIFAVYLGSGLRHNKETNTFTALNLLSGLAPPVGYSWIYPNECPNNLPCFHDLELGLAYAKKVGKPAMLDFTGYACVNCRKMEENVWPKEEIDKILRNDVVLISLYVDDKKELPSDHQGTYTTRNGSKKRIKTMGDKWSTLQSEYFNANTQPQYVLVTPDKKFISKTSYTPDVKQYEQFLLCGIKAFNQSK